MYFAIYIIGLITTFVGLKVYKEKNPDLFTDEHDDPYFLCPSLAWPVLLPLFLILFVMEVFCKGVDCTLGYYLDHADPKDQHNAESERTEE